MALTQDERTRVLVSGGVSEREYRDYMNACMTGNTAVEKVLERHLVGLFTPSHRKAYTINRGEKPEPFVSPDIYEEFVLPLLRVKGRVFRPVVVALNNPECPPHVLLAACASSHYRYLRAAGFNPSCPEEGKVLFVLTANPYRVVGTEGGSV